MIVVDRHVSPLSPVPDGSFFPGNSPGSAPSTLDLDRWRRRAWRLACHLTIRHALEDLIQPYALGCGFIVVDLPGPDLQQRLAPERFELVTALWWQLVACAEMTTALADIVLPFLRPVSQLGPILAAHPCSVSLVNAGLALEPDQVSVLYRLDDFSWQGLLHLLALHRRIRQQAAALNLDFWEAPDEP